ncbi:hypothetical protein ACFL6U_11765 [Planctomycetota bacterium]
MGKQRYLIVGGVAGGASAAARLRRFHVVWRGLRIRILIVTAM